MKSATTSAADGSKSAAMHAEDIQIINARALFPEGPVMSDGRLLYVEYAAHVVTMWDGTKNRRIWRQDGCGPSAIVPIGELFGITGYDSGELIVISRDWKTLRSYKEDDQGRALLGPNDGTPDGNGGAYFTLSGPWESGPIAGRVVHLAADGRLREVADDLHYANGIARAPDGRLYVNESEAGRVISFAIRPDGALYDRRLFIRLYQAGEPPDVYPDGIKVGPNGNFYIGEYSAGMVLEVSPNGDIVNKYKFPSAGAPNLTFGDDGKTMYVMAVDNKAAPFEGKVYAVALR